MKKRAPDPVEQPLSSRPWFVPAALLGLVVVTFLVYTPALRAGFIWDDDDYVTQNPVLRSAEGLVRVWTELGATPQYYPMVFTTFWLEHRLWGLNPFGYHAVNVLLHGLNAGLLWLLLRRLRVQGAWLAAGLFALHPVHVESVAWITERKNVLSGFFYLASAWTLLPVFLRDDGREDRFPLPRYLGGCALFLAALLSKTVTCSLPAALLLLVYWKRGSIDRRSMLRAAPLFALGLVLAFITVWMEKHHVGAKGAEFGLSPLERCLVAGRALCFYAGKLAWPNPLAFVYPRWEISASDAVQWLFPLIVIGALAWLWLSREKLGRGPLVAGLYFAGTLVPAIGFVDVYPFTFSWVADHFQYLASIGLMALAAASVYTFVAPRGRGWLAIPLLALAACGALTWRQAHIYRDLETLWRDTLANNPGSWMPLNNLGLELARQGRNDEAIGYYALAVAQRPDDPIGRYNHATALLGVGRFAEAAAELRAALALKPDYPAALFNLGAASIQMGDPAAAVDALRRGLDLQPGDVQARLLLARVLSRKGDVAGAEAQLREAARLAPDEAQVSFDLGLLLQQSGRAADAITAYRRALQLQPAFKDALVNLANTLAGTGRTDEAIDQYEAALRLDPADADVHFNLATVLLRRGQPGDGARGLEHARAFQRLDPKGAPEADRLLNELNRLMPK